MNRVLWLIVAFVFLTIFPVQAAVQVANNGTNLGVTEHLNVQGASTTESGGVVTINTLAETGTKAITGSLSVSGTTTMAGTISVTNAQVNGIATLASGNVTVNSTAVTGTTEGILLSYRTKNGTLGSLYPSAVTNATSFVITSTAGADDNSTVYWEVHN